MVARRSVEAHSAVAARRAAAGRNASVRARLPDSRFRDGRTRKGMRRKLSAGRRDAAPSKADLVLRCRRAMSLEELGRIRSAHTTVRSYLRFQNLTNGPASVIWIDFEGRGRLYDPPGGLQPGGFVDINSFADHLWVFRTADSGRRLCTVKNQDVYCAAAQPQHDDIDDDENEADRALVLIRTPVYRLRELCLMALDLLLTIQSNMTGIDALDIPSSLKESLCGGRGGLDYFGALHCPLEDRGRDDARHSPPPPGE